MVCTDYKLYQRVWRQIYIATMPQKQSLLKKPIMTWIYLKKKKFPVVRCRGSSEDDARRSVQSTPRLGRSRRGSDPPSHRARRDRSYDSERTAAGVGAAVVGGHRRGGGGAAGLDRSWETERLRGLELLQQSMDRERMRRVQQGKSARPGPPVPGAGPVGIPAAGAGAGGAAAAKTRPKRRLRKREAGNCEKLPTPDEARVSSWCTLHLWRRQQQGCS